MEPTDANRRAWDEMHRREPGPAIPPRVRDRLPPLDGLRALLIDAADATGAELAADGALVTLTRERVTGTSELAIVQTDPAHLPSELLRGRFDLVYLEPGALVGLQELDSLLAGVHAALRPLGWLVVFEQHPAAACLDWPELRWRGDYYQPGTWTLGDLVTAVSHAGLTVKRLEEFAGPDPRIPGEFLLRAEKPQ
jgi:hypothetical protein